MQLLVSAESFLLGFQGHVSARLLATMLNVLSSMSSWSPPSVKSPGYWPGMQGMGFCHNFLIVTVLFRLLLFLLFRCLLGELPSFEKVKNSPSVFERRYQGECGVSLGLANCPWQFAFKQTRL